MQTNEDNSYVLEDDDPLVQAQIKRRDRKHCWQCGDEIRDTLS